MTIQDYIEQLNDTAYGVEGFTIGRGKKVYRFFTPVASSRFVGYRVLPVESDSTLGWPRWITADTQVTVVMK